MKIRPMAARSVLLATGAFAVALLSACSEPQAATGAASLPPPAQVATPLTRDVPVTRSLPAHVEAIERVELRSRVDGFVERIAFAEGAQVEQGQLLVEIDARPYRAALATAEAALAQARAQASVALREAERASRLVAIGAISHEEAERRAAQARVAEAAVDSSAALADRARLDLADTRIVAPFTGRIGRAEIARGNLVSSADRLAVLVRMDAVYVRFDLDERSFAQATVAPAQWRARFTLPDQPSLAFEGKVAFVDNEVQSGTGTVRIRARLANPQGLLTPGRYGKVELTLGARDDALLIDDKALGSDQGQRFVLVVGADGVAQYRPVTPGAKVGALRVIEDGLAPNDRVVVNGLMRVRPGMPVTPIEVPMQAVAATPLPSLVGAVASTQE